MKKNIYILAIFLSSLFCFSACHKNEVVSPDNNADNIPVVSNAQNAFSFVVAAKSYSYSDNHNLQFNGDTLIVAITLNHLLSGAGEVSILDGNNSVIYNKKITSDIVSADVIKLTAVPANIKIDLNNFSGSLVLSAAAK